LHLINANAYNESDRAENCAHRILKIARFNVFYHRPTLVAMVAKPWEL